MLAANFTERHWAPVDPREQFSERIWRRTIEFYKTLFSTRIVNGELVDDLAGIVSPNFVEDEHPLIVHGDGHVAVRGLAGLQAYRKQFNGPDGPPLLVSLETAAVPASRTWEVPGLGGEQYDAGTVLRFGVRPPGRGTLSEEAARYDGPLMYVCLREDVLFTGDPKTRRMMVDRRMYDGYDAIGDQGYLGPDTTPRNHGELVGMQIGHIAATGTEMPLRPLTEVYSTLFPDVEIAPVQSR